MNFLRPLVFATALPPPLAHAGDNALDPEAWPRTYWVGDAEVSIYLPQIFEWSEFLHLKANAAVGVKLKGRDGYLNRQSPAGQLNRDAYSRQRAGSERPTPQRSRR